MKKWNKPEMIDLDLKLTQTDIIPHMSGGGSSDPTDTYVTCPNPECGKVMKKSDFHNAANHKGKCEYFKNCIGPGCPCQ